MSESTDDDRLSYEDLLLDRDATADLARRLEKRCFAEERYAMTLRAALLSRAAGEPVDIKDDETGRRVRRDLDAMAARFEEAAAAADQTPSTREMARALFASRQPTLQSVIADLGRELNVHRGWWQGPGEWLTAAIREIRRLRSAEQGAQRTTAALSAHVAALRSLGVTLSRPDDAPLAEVVREAVAAAESWRGNGPKAVRRATDAEASLARIQAAIAECDSQWRDTKASLDGNSIPLRIRRWWGDIRSAWKALEGRASPALHGSLGDAIASALKAERKSVESWYGNDRMRNNALRLKVRELEVRLAERDGDRASDG